MRGVWTQQSCKWFYLCCRSIFLYILSYFRIILFELRRFSPCQIRFCPFPALHVVLAGSDLDIPDLRNESYPANCVLSHYLCFSARGVSKWIFCIKGHFTRKPLNLYFSLANKFEWTLTKWGGWSALCLVFAASWFSFCSLFGIQESPTTRDLGNIIFSISRRIFCPQER